MKFIPRDYQKKIIEAQSKKASFVIATMGAGKTASTLYTIKKGLEEQRFTKVLIVAPKFVCTNVWPLEIAKWSNLEHLEYAICVGTKKQKDKAILSGKSITIANNEALVYILENYPKFVESLDYLIVDESSSFKQSASKRFKALKKIRKHTKYCTLLTGTPISNSHLDLWSQVFLLDFGERLGRTFTKYKHDYFTSDYLGYKYSITKDNSEIIERKISGLTLVVDKYNGLKDKEEIVNYVNLSAKAMKIYNDFKKDFILQLGDDEITAMNSAVLTNKLQQVTSGAIYTNETKDYTTIHNEKLDALEQLLSETNENVLVAYSFKHDYARIKERFDYAIDIKKAGAIDDWNNGKIKLLLAHPKSAGHGLNLQSGGRRIIWYSLSWSSELTLQFNARLHRNGQSKTTFIHKLVAKGTIDERIVNTANNKISLQKLIIDYLKALTTK